MVGFKPVLTVSSLTDSYKCQSLSSSSNLRRRRKRSESISASSIVVKASLGHVKDLPKKDLAVDVDNDFKPRYEVIEGKKKLMAELKTAAKGVDSVYLAADPDREGEAICYHLQEELQDQKERREVLPRDVQRDH